MKITRKKKYTAPFLNLMWNEPTLGTAAVTHASSLLHSNGLSRSNKSSGDSEQKTKYSVQLVFLKHLRDGALDDPAEPFFFFFKTCNKEFNEQSKTSL